MSLDLLSVISALVVTKIITKHKLIILSSSFNLGYYSSTGVAEDMNGTMQCLPCSAGSSSIPGSLDCTMCSPGYYAPIEASSSCYACAVGEVCEDPGCTKCYECDKQYYISDGKCVRCPYPMLSMPGTTDKCVYVNLMIAKPTIIAIAVPLFVLYLFGLSYTTAEKTNKFDSIKIYFGIFLITFLPLIDLITDIIYILTNDFYNSEIFLFMLFFFIVPMILFFKYLYAKNIRARFPIVPIPDTLFFEKYDNILKIIFSGIVLSPYIFINLPFLLPMLLYGMFLYVSNLLSITRIKRFWLLVWTGIEQDEFLEVADPHTLNECIYGTILLESFPQLVIQAINNSKLNMWTNIAILSSVISGFSCLNGLYRVVYFKFIKGINLIDVPIDISLAGVNFIRIDCSKNSDVKVKDLEQEQTVSSCIHDEHDFNTEASEPLLILQESVSKISQFMRSENKNLKEEILSIKSENNHLKEEIRSIKSENKQLNEEVISRLSGFRDELIAMKGQLDVKR